MRRSCFISWPKAEGQSLRFKDWIRDTQRIPGKKIAPSRRFSLTRIYFESINIVDGSLRGSKGNSVRAWGRHAEAAPATVSGESADHEATGGNSGKAVRGNDP